MAAARWFGGVIIGAVLFWVWLIVMLVALA